MEDGKRALTPMLLVMVAIGGTDILFALDSIPAIFGLTQNVYIVFTATAFSLLGLRQLYFLIDGLLDRLIYLSYGLAAILGFIGVKLILHALHENNVPFINDGEPVEVIEISTGLSLCVIIGVLVVTVVASLFSPQGRGQDRDRQRPSARDGLPRLGVHPQTLRNGNASSDCCWLSAIRSSRSVPSTGAWSATNRPSWNCSSVRPPSTTRQSGEVRPSRSPEGDSRPDIQPLREPTVTVRVTRSPPRTTTIG